MGNCGSVPGKKVDFSKYPFEEILFRIEGATLKFMPQDAKYIELLDNPMQGSSNPQSESQNMHLNEDLEKTKQDITEKREKVKKLKSNIRELEEKHAQLMKILNVDFNEKDYIDKLVSKYEENNKETHDQDHEVALDEDEF